LGWAKREEVGVRKRRLGGTARVEKKKHDKGGDEGPQTQKKRGRRGKKPKKRKTRRPKGRKAVKLEKTKGPKARVHVEKNRERGDTNAGSKKAP